MQPFVTVDDVNLGLKYESDISHLTNIASSCVLRVFCRSHRLQL